MVELPTPGEFASTACEPALPDEVAQPAELSESELADILANPGDYYVQLHTVRFPQGAVRGQLTLR